MRATRVARWPRVLALFILAGLRVTHAATPPTLVNYQGVLRDASDKPRTGTFDMVFGFFDAAGAGNQILLDAHTGGGGNAVTVSGGLFSVQLGGGTITDGSGAGTYAALDQVFRDYDAVWLEIKVGAETLSPRVRVQSAAYALNASNLQGKDASNFVDTSSTDQTKGGHLTVGGGIDALRTTGYGIAAYGGDAGGFFNDGFGDFAYAALQSGGIGLFGVGSMGGYFAAKAGYGFVTLANQNEGVNARGDPAGIFTRPFGGTGTAYLGYGLTGITASGAPAGQFAAVYGVGAIDVASGDFGALGHGRYPGAGGYFDDPYATGKSWIGFGDEGIYSIGAYAGGYFTRSYHNVQAFLGSADYSNHPVAVYGYSSEAGAYPAHFRDDYTGAYAWVGSNGAKIVGNGSVGFIQNHPTDAGKTIVYAAPEGDEVAVYTRGTARLVDGEARVTLGETFALVANPDIGLTATVTPNGEAVALSVADKSTRELHVRGPAGSNAEFDYMVWGLRIGFEARAVVTTKREEAYIPSHSVEEDEYAKAPELRSFSALSRYTRMRQSLTGRAAAPDLTASIALESAIHVFDRATDARGPHMDGPEPVAPAVSSASADRTPGQRGENAVGGTAPAPPSASAATEGAVHGASVPVHTTLVAVVEAVEPGDVLANDPAHPGELRRSALAADPGVIGIVAGAAGTSWTEEAPVALPGTIVLCKVDASYAAIVANDLLVASATPGYAMRAGDAAKQGSVIGKALEPLAAGMGAIRVLVMSR